VTERLPAQTLLRATANPQSTRTIEKALKTCIATMPMGFLVEGCFQRPHSLSKNNFADHGFSSSGCHIKERLSADGKLSHPFVSLMKEKSKSDWDAGSG
jgi:hypothetical protein